MATSIPPSCWALVAAHLAIEKSTRLALAGTRLVPGPNRVSLAACFRAAAARVSPNAAASLDAIERAVLAGRWTIVGENIHIHVGQDELAQLCAGGRAFDDGIFDLLKLPVAARTGSLRTYLWILRLVDRGENGWLVVLGPALERPGCFAWWGQGLEAFFEKQVAYQGEE